MRGLPVVTLGSALALGDGKGAGQFLLGFAVNAGVTEGLKIVLPKERPDGSDRESFPSGHTSIAFQSAAFLHFRYGLRYGAPVYGMGAFVAYSRVHARKHFVEDVLVGMVLGVASSALVTDRRRKAGAPTPQAGLTLGVRLDFGSGLAARLTGGVY